MRKNNDDEENLFNLIRTNTTRLLAQYYYVRLPLFKCFALENCALKYPNSRPFKKILPFVRLMRSGIFFVVFIQNKIMIVRNPIKIEERTVNNTMYRKIDWNDGKTDFFLDNVHFFPDFVGNFILSILGKKITSVKQIINYHNLEQRTALLKLYGYDNVLKELQSTCLDLRPSNFEGKNLELLEVDVIDDDYFDAKFFKFVDTSTGKEGVIRVPPHIKTIEEAKAWTFGFSEKEFEKYHLFES